MKKTEYERENPIYDTDNEDRQYVLVVNEDGVVSQREIRQYKGAHFWRVNKHLLISVFRKLNISKPLSVVLYVLDNVRADNNRFTGTISETAGKRLVNVKVRTVETVFKKMQDADMMVKVRNGEYMINPEIMMIGDNKKKESLIREYKHLHNVQIAKKLRSDEDPRG